MKNKAIPSLIAFLDMIDPNNTINRGEAALDFGLVVAMKSAADEMVKLSPKGIVALNKLIDDPTALSVESIYKIFYDEKKDTDFTKAVAINIEPATLHYISEQMKKLPKDQTKVVLENFPELKVLLNKA